MTMKLDWNPLDSCGLLSSKKLLQENQILMIPGKNKPFSQLLVKLHIKKHKRENIPSKQQAYIDLHLPPRHRHRNLLNHRESVRIPLKYHSIGNFHYERKLDWSLQSPFQSLLQQ